MTRKNRRFSPTEKVRILKRHLVERVPISEVCSSEKIAPTQFYSWQKTFFEQGASAFERGNERAQKAQADRVEQLEAKLTRKDRVISELTEELIDQKKALGGT